MTTLVWFRQDLRLADNPALFHAAERGPVIPVYILEDGATDARPPGGASRWWLHHSLHSLSDRLGTLVLRRGDPDDVLADLANQTGATAVHWNRRYEPAGITTDTTVKTVLRSAGLDVRSFNAALLHEPWEVETGSGGPFKVFSPFWRAARARDTAAPLPAPEFEIGQPPAGDRLEDWELLPGKSRLGRRLAGHLDPR